MSKQLFKEEQSYHGKDVLAWIGIIIIGLVYLVFKDVLLNGLSQPVVDFVAVLLIAGLAWWMRSLYKRRLKTTITEKKIICELSAGQEQKYKIPFKNIASCAIVKTPLAAQWNGANLSFGDEKMITVNGRNGLAIQTRDGKHYFVGSSRINELEATLKQIFPREMN